MNTAFRTLPISAINERLDEVRREITALDRTLKTELALLANGHEPTDSWLDTVSIYHAYAAALAVCEMQQNMGSLIGMLGNYWAIARSEAPPALRIAHYLDLKERYEDLLKLVRETRALEREPLPVCAAA